MRHAPRVLFLPADGRGLGHMSRTGKLAQAIRGGAVCMIASGRRDGRHLFPDGCEYALVPHLDTVLPFWISEHGQPRAAGALPADALAARQGFLEGLVRSFGPDVIVIDHWPAGVLNELREILGQSRAWKILVLRPAPGNDGVRALHGLGVADVRKLFDLVLIAGDRRTALVDEDLDLQDSAGLGGRYIGYVSLAVSSAKIAEVRRQRGLGPRDRWIVCSVGSGFYDRALIPDCMRLSREFGDVQFDLVRGPAAPGETVTTSRPVDTTGRVRLTEERSDLRAVHAAADVVICHGGYNTLTEAMEGGAALVVDTRGDVHRERARHVGRLQPYYPLACGEGAADLARNLRAALSDERPRRSIRDRGSLDFDGCREFARVLLARETQGVATGVGADGP